MALESMLSFITTPAIHAKPDVGRVNSEGQNKRENKDQSKHDSHAGAGGQDAGACVHPVPNTLGEITGKLIDTTA
jgi:hypothetical protein